MYLYIYIHIKCMYIYVCIYNSYIWVVNFSFSKISVPTHFFAPLFSPGESCRRRLRQSRVRPLRAGEGEWGGVCGGEDDWASAAAAGAGGAGAGGAGAGGAGGAEPHSGSVRWGRASPWQSGAGHNKVSEGRHWQVIPKIVIFIGYFVLLIKLEQNCLFVISIIIYT